MNQESEVAAAAVPATEVTLSPRASTLLRKGQHWFFHDDVAAKVPVSACLVRLRCDRGVDHGLATFSPRGRIALRRCGGWEGGGVPAAEAFFARRLQAALGRRPAADDPSAGVRLVHGEGDDLPGLVLDRYADVVVLQSTSSFVEESLDAIVPWLVERFDPVAVVARNDTQARKHEQLPREVRLLHGRRVTEVVIEEDSVRHRVEPFTGHKTGFYLDQRPARRRVRELAAGRRVLDLFSYQGAFSLAALAGGATSAVAVDQSAAALERAQSAATEQGIGPLQTVQDNVFDHLRGLRDSAEQFDLIVLDPPAFARSRRELEGAIRGYRDLNRQALRLLAPGGLLLTCSCSHHMTLPRFEEVVRHAAAGLPFPVVTRERIGAGWDHPAVVTLPESEYLKVLLLQRQDEVAGGSA
jgi:23S rRNA (cytosine1962-C5)-methyltransferase